VQREGSRYYIKQPLLFLPPNERVFASGQKRALAQYIPEKCWYRAQILPTIYADAGGQPRPNALKRADFKGPRWCL
jgi:ABC-type uncharacterized transport system YnjBCD permease subunit